MATVSFTGEVTATLRLVTAASAAGCRTALLPSDGQGTPVSFADLASLIGRAAAGLAGRGLRPRDVVGVYVPDAFSYVLARHAIAAAGGVPSPVSPRLPIAQIADQLADCGARMLLTAQPLAPASVAAADRSWVRQVICFGDAPATTPFSALLGPCSLPPVNSRPGDLALLCYARAAGGCLQPVGLTHLEMASRLADLAGSAGLSERDVVLAAPPAGDGRSYTGFVDHALLHQATIVAAETGELPAAAARHHCTAVIGPAGADAGNARLFQVDC